MVYVSYLWWNGPVLARNKRVVGEPVNRWVYVRNLDVISGANDGGCRGHGLVASEARRLADFVRRLVVATRVFRVSHSVGNVVEVTRLDYE